MIMTCFYSGTVFITEFNETTKIMTAHFVFLASSHFLQEDTFKEICSQRVSFISEERGWRDKPFATNFMKIGGSVL